jgi:hypothetical protein
VFIVDVKLRFLLSVKIQWFRMSIGPFADSKWCYGRRHDKIIKKYVDDGVIKKYQYY